MKVMAVARALNGLIVTESDSDHPPNTLMGLRKEDWPFKDVTED